MHTRIQFLLLTVLILTGCMSPQETEKPNPEAVAVAVALTLTAQPTVTHFITDTPISPTASDTPELTNTPISPTGTATPTLTSTPFASDPAVQLGSPTFMDNLDTGKGFGLTSGSYKDDYSSWQISNGVLTVKSLMNNGWHSWRLRPPKIKNFYVQTILTPQSCSGADEFGLLFRAPDYESGLGYYLGITCEGQFRLNRQDSDKVESIIPLTSTSLLSVGTGQSNRLGVWVQNSNIQVYANGKPVQAISDSGISDAGFYGLFVAGYSGKLAVNVDEIAYWTLP